MSSPHSIIPSPPFPFPPHFYHPLANPLYRLSPLLTASGLLSSNPLLFFQHKSQMEVVEEHRKLLLSFGIPAGSLVATEEETKEDVKDIDDEPDVKVEVDVDDEEADIEENQDGENDQDDPVDLTFKSSDEEGLAQEED